MADVSYQLGRERQFHAWSSDVASGGIPAIRNAHRRWSRHCCTGLGGGHELYCLHNFWKFRRRRKALQSGAEHGVRVGVAAGCAIELCERERGAQFEAAGLRLATASAARNASSAAGSAGLSSTRISPRVRWSSASNQRWPLRSKSLSDWSSVASAAALP